MAEVLDFPVALDVGESQVPHLGDDAAQDAVDRQEVVIDLYLGNKVEDHPVQDGDDHPHHQAAHRPLHRLFGGEMGGEGMFAQKHAHQHGPGIHHEGDEDGQEDVAGPQLQSPHPHHGGQAVGDDKGKEEARTHPVHLHPQMAGEGLQKDRQQVDQQHQQAPLAGLPKVDPEGDGQGHDGGVQGDAGVVHANGMEGLIGAHRGEHGDEGGGKGRGQNVQDHQDHRHAHTGHQNTISHVIRLQICADAAGSPPGPRPGPRD